MSRTLKRPMFRKGGEVMEGIMTGIKPREKFQDKGMSDNTFKRIQSDMNLVDRLAGVGSSPLSDPLTQFLLGTGQRLIGGEAAGGTKLQEIVGATKQPLELAIKQQALKDAGRRKLAAQFLSKSNIGEARKAYQDYGKAKYATFEEFLPVYAEMKLSQSRKSKSAEDIAYETKKERVDALVEGSKIGELPPDIIYDDANKTINALDKLKADPERKNIPVSNKKPYVDSDDAAKAFGEQEIITVTPDSEYINGVYYYNYNNNSWYQFDGEKLIYKFAG